MSRGSILCRRDPRDRNEWQFSLDQEVAYKDTQQRHQVSFEASQKVEVLEWINAKNIGSMLEGSEQEQLGEDALSEVLPEKEKKKRKGFLAIKDRESENDSEEDGQADKEKLKATVDEAGVPSELGKNQSKDGAAKRIVKMVTLLKTLKHDLSKGSSGSKDTAHAKCVQTSLDSLQKLVKQGNKVNMEAAKNELLEALAVKRVSKALKQ